MQNGTRKGGAVPVFETLRKSPGFEDVWQLHWSVQRGHRAQRARRVHRQRGRCRDDRRRVDRASGRRTWGTRWWWGRARRTGRTGRRRACASGPRDRRPTPAPRHAASRRTGGGRRTASRRATCDWRAVPRRADRVDLAGPGGPAAVVVAAAQPRHTPAYYIKVSAQADGTFTVTNMRNGFSKTYPEASKLETREKDEKTRKNKKALRAPFPSLVPLT